jgi:hypothetical protein
VAKLTTIAPEFISRVPQLFAQRLVGLCATVAENSWHPRNYGKARMRLTAAISSLSRGMLGLIQLTAESAHFGAKVT